MPRTPTPDELYTEACAVMPRWGQPDPGGGGRRRALNRLRKAAEAGHVEAMKMLADGYDQERAGEWAVRLAKVGETGPLVSALTDTDHPPSLGLGVLAAARAGEAWAMLAVGEVYLLGMADARTGKLVATEDGAWGWLPGAPKPAAEGAAWVTRAHEAGWAPATLHLVERLRRKEPARAFALLGEALARVEQLVPSDRKRAARRYAELAEEVGLPLAEQHAARRALAESGDADAMAWLGERYRDGEGVPADAAEARAWFTRAADAGSVDGCRELGKLLEAGLGGPVDEEGARARYEAAAELGADAYARDRLASRFGLTWYARGPGE